MLSILQMGKLRPRPLEPTQITTGGGSWTRPRVSHIKSCFSLHQLLPPVLRPVSRSVKQHRFQKTPETVILPSYVNCAILRQCTPHAGPGSPGPRSQQPHTLPPPVAASTHSSKSRTWRRRSAASRLTAGSWTRSAAFVDHFRSPAASRALGRE